jgi:protein-disulfide isomerase
MVAALTMIASCRSKEATQPVESPSGDEGEASEAFVSEPPAPAPKVVEAAPGEPDPRVLYQVPLQGNEPQMGPDDALITIVEFGDFDCPFCKERAPTLVQLREKYRDDLRVIWMNYPLPGHRNARPAATAALEAQAQKGHEGFWRMHDKLFENQGSLDRQTLERLGQELGLDMRKLRHALDSDKYAEAINRDMALGTKLAIPGTPSYYMNGRFMAGFPLQTWSYAIDSRIGSVRRLVESGVPRSELYERIIETGKESP